MSSQEDFADLISTIENNLEEMGVENATFDLETGLMGLVDHILEIETGSNVEIPTTIECSFPTPNPSEPITVGDSYTCSGTLSGSYNDFSFKIGGATIYAYNEDDLLGQAVTDSDGNFTINGMYHKATNHIEYSTKFLATDIFLSSMSTLVMVKPVNKKAMVLPQNIPDNWYLTLDTYTVNIGTQYQDAPISLYLGGEKYSTENVDTNGQVSFDVENSHIAPLSNQWQLVVETNDVYEDAQSNVFTVNIGVSISIDKVTVGKRTIKEMSMTLSSNKDILSYADGDIATITAQLIDDAPTPQELEIPNYNIIFSVPTNYTDISDIPTQYGSFAISFKATQGTVIIKSSHITLNTTLTIPSNNNSQFQLVWDGTNMRLYQDGNYLQNSVVNIMGYYDVYVGNDVIFVNHNGITFSDIYIGDFETTDDTGKATFTYNSQGVGDVIISANIEGSLLTKTYSIEDCWKYDASSSSGVSNYDTSLLNGSLSYDTTQSAYKVTKISNGYGILFDNRINLPVNVVITADMMVISGSGNHHIANGIGLYDSSESLGVGCHFVKHHSAHEFDLITFNASSSVSEWGKDSNVSTSSNTWYHIEVKITDTTVTAKMYLNDTVISSHTHSNTVNSGNDNKLAFMQYVVNGTSYFKNIKVKPNW